MLAAARTLGPSGSLRPFTFETLFGLMASTILVLFAVPAFYAIIDDFGFTTLAEERRAAARGTHAEVGA